MRVQHCFVDGETLQTAPQLRLLQGLSLEREQARLQARAALRACLALELGCPEDALHIGNQRNQAPQLWLHSQRSARPFCSISHAPGLALLAWHDAGPVGVDIQAVSHDISRHELLAVAQLYLKPNMAQSLDDIAQDALFFKAFSSAWAEQEARLKCMGQSLVEWSDVLQTQLENVYCTAFTPVAGYAAAAAWRAHSGDASP